MRKLLLIIFGVIMTCGIYAQKDDFFYIEEMHLPSKYKLIIDSLVLPCIKQSNRDFRNTVVTLSVSDRFDSIIRVSVCEPNYIRFNSAMYYQYYDSVLVLTYDEDFGKYIIPGKKSLFMKRPFTLQFYHPPTWVLQDKDDDWVIIDTVFCCD